MLAHAATQKRRVQFVMNDDGTVNTESKEAEPIMGSCNTSEDLVMLKWYTRDEISSRKKLLKELTMEISDRNLLDQDNPCNYTNTFQRLFNQCQKGDNSFRYDEMYPWMLWIKATPQRRGLENMSMPSLGRARKRRIRKYIIQVIEDYNSSLSLDQDELWDSVAREACKASRSDRMFAVCLGIADEVAARDLCPDENNHSTGQRLSRTVLGSFHELVSESLRKLFVMTKPTTESTTPPKRYSVGSHRNNHPISNLLPVTVVSELEPSNVGKIWNL
jgi:hypothetical protein